MQLGSARYLYYKVSRQDKNVNTHPRRAARTLSVSFVFSACALHHIASIVSSIMLLMRRRGCASHYHSDLAFLCEMFEFISADSLVPEEEND